MSLKARLRLSILALVGVVVIAISALYISDFTSLAFGAASARADLIASQVKGYLLETIDQRTPTPTGTAPSIEQSKRLWTEIVRSDPHIRGLLKRTSASADVVLSIYVTGEDGTILVASTPYLVGMRAPLKPSLSEVQRRSALRNVWDLFRKREDYITTLPLGIPGQPKPIFAITVVIRSVLLQNALRPAFGNLAVVFAASLAVALVLAFFLPNFVLYPLVRVSQRIDQIRTGDFEAMPLGIREESREFADVQAKLGLLGQQFRGARQDALELRSNIEDLLQKLEEAVLMFDASGRLIMAGTPAQRLLGRENGELIGRNLDELFPKDTVLGALVQRSLEQHQPVHDEFVTVKANGAKPVRLLVNIETLRKGTDHPAGHQEIGTLITLRDAETRDPVEFQLDVSSRLSAISRLTGGIAHEIKNPLNAMALHLEVLKMKLDAAQPEIEVISSEIQRLDHVVKTFLNFNRPVELQRQALNLSELASEVVDLIRPDAESRSIEVQTELDEPVWMNGDPDLIRQAVLNVVVNAIDALDNQGLGARLSVQAEHRDSLCVLTIADNGPGIPPEIRDKIFNLYFSTKQSGSGMGLAMTFRAVQLHSGTIEVSDVNGKGTAFRLQFPMAKAPVTEAAVSQDKL